MLSSLPLSTCMKDLLIFSFDPYYSIFIFLSLLDIDSYFLLVYLDLI